MRYPEEGNVAMASSSPAHMLSNPYLYLYTFGSFSNGLFISLRGPIIPELATRVGASSPASLGTYLGIGGVSGGVFAIPTGLLLDRVDPHAVFAAGCVLRALSVGAMPLCTAIWQVNALAVAQGATLPMIGVSIRVCLVRVFHERCAAALNFTMGAFGLASIVAPLAFAALDAAMPVHGAGFDATFAACAASYVALALVASVAKTPDAADDGNDDDGRSGGSRIVGDELGDEIPIPGGASLRDGANLDAEGGSGEWDRGRVDASTAAPLTVLVPMVAYMALNVAGEVTFGSWIFTVARAREGLSVSTAAALTSTFWACFTATRFALGLVRDLRPLTALAWSHVAALSALATLATYWSGPGSASGWALWTLTGIVGAGTAGLFPNGIAQGSRMFPLTGLRQALFELGAATGAGVGPFLAARWYAESGEEAWTVAASCAGFLAAGAVTLGSALVADGARARTSARRVASGNEGMSSEATAAEMRRPLLDGEVGDGDDGGFP